MSEVPGAFLGVRLHSFPYYPTEQLTFLKFLNFPCGLLPPPPCKQTLDCILPLITLELLQNQSFQLPEPERCLSFFSFCLHLFAPWLTAGETRDLKDAGIFCSFFPSCPRRCHACVLHWHANNTQSNGLAQGLRRTPRIPRHSVSVGRLSVQSCTLETLSLGVLR